MSKITVQSNLFALIIFTFALLPSLLLSQPALDPGSTVDPATGRMMFQLPLETVRGAGIDYPINLGYAAGIQYYQEASSVGLGFSVDPPCISRSVVFVPDDNSGGRTAKFEGLSPTKINCAVEIPWWGHVLRFLFSGGFSLFVPNHYDVGMQTGGVPGKTIEYDLNSSENDGEGFFRGGQNDLPDIYVVTTPWVNGRLLWVGDYQTGHFSFMQTLGAGWEQNKSTNKVEYFKYDSSNPSTAPVGGKFIMTLADGTRLFFEKSDAFATSSQTYIHIDDGGNECTADGYRKIKEASPVKWWLTKVLTNRYHGGDDPESSGSNGWVVFKYNNANENLAIFRKTGGENVVSASTLNSIVLTHIGKSASDYENVRLYNLARIVTPNEYAVINYTGYRQDVSWYLTGSSAVYTDVCPVLDSISIYSKKDVIRQSLKFTTDYVLRPNTFGSRATDNKSLTLQSVSITDGMTKKLPPVLFHYDMTFNKSALEREVGNSPGHGVCYVANRDIWGYYYNNANSDWHAAGVDENADAQAWSLDGITLPEGMSIWWEYEENRYDSANGGMARETPVAGCQPPGTVKYGGGIRVKKVLFDNGMEAKNNATTYYYAEDVNAVIDMINAGTSTTLPGSGHATCEPVPAMTYGNGTCNDDKRADRAKGGLYTEAEVQYGKTIVVKEPLLSNGATVFEHYTSADFPNTGEYGDGDKSWKRGHLKAKSVYNSSKKQVMREDYT